MRRTLLSICLLFALSAPIATGAQTTAPSASPDPPEWADPFCSVSDQLIYWDTAKGHGTSDATKHLLGKLFAPGSSVAAHLILLTDTDAYEVQIGRQSLSGTEYFRSSARFLVEFPKDVQIKYSFVDSYKLDDGVGKRVLKLAASRVLDHDVVYRKKQGFGAPMDQWFAEPGFGQHCMALYERSEMAKSGMLDDEYVTGMLQAQMAAGGGHGFHLWTIFNAVLWQEAWLGGNRAAA